MLVMIQKVLMLNSSGKQDIRRWSIFPEMVEILNLVISRGYKIRGILKCCYFVIPGKTGRLGQQSDIYDTC